MTHPFFTTRSRALPLLAASLLAAATQAEHKVPGPLPNMQDVKTAAPLVVKPPVPAGLTAPLAVSTARRAPDTVKLPSGAEASVAAGRERVFLDEVDGTLWARGHDWKASFTAEGATLIPIFGATAPRNFGIEFDVLEARRGAAALALEAPAVARRSETRVELDRGALVEAYDMTTTSVEQTFRFASLPENGADLVVRLGFETELAASRADDGGIVFANEHGRLHYSAAKALDATGRVLPIDTALLDGVLEFTVPQSFLATATFPVTIDPVTSVFAVNTSNEHNYYPDVAYLAGSDRFLVVYEEDVSGFDHDVYATLLTGTGAFVTSFYVDQTSELWALPSVAANGLSGQFLVVCERWAFSPWSIKGRMVNGSTGVPAGTTFTINEGTDDHREPVVGGDPVLVGPTYFLVAYRRVFSTTDHDIHARLVTSSGTPTGTTIYIDNSGSTLDSLPAISKSDGVEPYATQNWNIVWRREYSATDHDVYGAQVLWDGTITTPSFLIDFSGQDDVDVAVSSPLDGASGPRPYMLAIQRVSGSQHDIIYSVWQGSTNLTSGDLQALEGLGFFLHDQVTPSIDSDGRKFLLCYSEQYQSSTSDYDTWVASLELVGGQVVVSEAHQTLGFTIDGERDTAIVSKHSGGALPASGAMAVWTNYNPSPTAANIHAGLVATIPFSSFCVPQINAIVCPCGNFPGANGLGCNNSFGSGGAFLYASGSPSTDTVVLNASGMIPTGISIFLQGSSLANSSFGVGFGDGVRCIGTLIRLGTKTTSGGAAAYPETGDQSILARSVTLGAPIPPGSQRFYQTYYRDPAAGFGCGGLATYNITTGVVVDW